MDVTKMTISELAGYTYDCECNRTHNVDVKKIVIGENAINEAVDYIIEQTDKMVMIICDDTTYELAGMKFEKLLPTSQTYIIHERNNVHVAPNESYVGEVLIKIPKNIDFFLAVGSGVINDITRQVSYMMDKPYVVFGTAPSMDGYASSTSSLIINNIKESIQGQSPVGIFADSKMLQNAPYEMITAGFGDVIGKYNAIREWQFGRDYKKEHYCQQIVDAVMSAVKKCETNASNLKKREPQAIISIMEGLILAGMTMGMYQNTRPASGAEHHIVHYWDVDCIKRGVEHPLHGNSVGVGTVIICLLYDLVKNHLPVPVMELDGSKISSILTEAGCKISPVDLNISRELLKESIVKGHTMSSKFTILTYLSQEKPKVLENAAEQICDMFFY
ncbi:MAG: sn-glycerol-1-phosphate dehydrogenase [Clostridiales bacterium]|nr:sn-glycerol-1-phosphate dehydrogenase [Clostridiales bacterium]